MFKLNGKSLALDVAFSNGDINYPANWLRHASLSEKNAIGITEVAGPAWYDQRFYWGVGKPKTLADLKTNWISQQKATAGSLLSKTDWMIIRKEEASTAVPGATQTYRTAVRAQCKKREDQITACSDTDALCALITASATIAGTADNGATEKKDKDDKSYDPKQYENVVNPAALEAWPTE
jgi:hypothetical protein